MNGTLQATVMVPTMSGRGPLLPLSVGSILAQTVTDLEVFIMGDGVDDDTRRVIHGLMKLDPRIKFFDHPKHERRGEPHRHAALAQARGRIVCYLCDRDLMLPHHLQVMSHLLQNADFAHTLIARVAPAGHFEAFTSVDLANPADRNWTARTWTAENGIPLSFAGHTAAIYRELPWGWRTTPPERTHTDIYMWEQFLNHSACRTISGSTPTILYFPRYQRATWTIEQKQEELERWRNFQKEEGWIKRLLQLTIDGCVRDRLTKGRQIRSLAGGIKALVNHCNQTLAGPGQLTTDN